jgi:hypothetical protein
MADEVTENFNMILEEFIKKLVVTFPEQVKLNSYYKAFKLSKIVNQKLPLQLFMGGCTKFSVQIKNRDEIFFKNEPIFVDKCYKYSSFTKDIGLVDYWESMSSQTKNSIWDYIQTLFVMGEMFLNKNTTLKQKTHEIYQGLSEDELTRFENDDVNQFSDDFLKKIK